MAYDYYEATKENVIEYIRDNITSTDYSDRDELSEYLNDELWINDSVTGNASGSYTFNSYRAKEYVTDNMDLVAEMCSEFGVTDDEAGRHFLNEDWEWFDVSIRCYVLGSSIEAALDEIEDELTFQYDVIEDEDEDETLTA